jgi:hypothetical protein
LPRREDQVSSIGLSRLARWALWLPVAAYAIIVARGFFLYSGSAIYLSTDDALANISYALATEGRYGFLSSPILFEMPRHQGLFSYGPFYFYAAAALIWLFGYSLTIVRSIHLLVMIAIAIAAHAWFGRRAAGAVSAIVAVSVLLAFERGQWPMVRPDSMVSLFAIALVISAGLAISTGHARYWVLAGLSAACGALTHLVAWSLIPASLVILLVGSVISARARLIPNVIALAAGGLVSAALFYASFGFRIGDQWRFLGGYQDYTGSGAGAASGSFGGLVLQHFNLAYWFLPAFLRYAAWATLLAGVATVIVLIVRRHAPWSRAASALIVPPVIAWVGYLLSLGVYNNFHSGYTILNQVLWIWCAGALVAAALGLLEYRPRFRRPVTVAAWVVALAYAVGVLTLLQQRTEYRALAAAAAVPIDEYVSRVLEPLPAGARAWGSVVFGIEHPGRLQLIQLDDAITMVGALSRETRARLAPDYLILGVADAGASVLGTLNGMQSLPHTLAGLLPDVRYDVVAMTAGSPYGVTRVYARRQERAVEPVVSVYDAQRRQWTRALGPPVSLAMAPAPPGEIHVDGIAAARKTAAQTLSAELPAGTYVIRISLPMDAREDLDAVFAASGRSAIRQSFSEYGAASDIAAAFPGAGTVDLVYAHPGGTFFVSQFGAATPSIASVQALRLLPLRGFDSLRTPAPTERALRAIDWTLPDPIPQGGSPPVRIVHTPSADGRSLKVDGNAVQFAYQAFGPEIPVAPFAFVRLRLAATVEAGTACWGVLDGTGTRWLVLPDRLQSEYEFQVNDTGTVKPVLAECTGVPGNTTPVQATILDGSYATWPARGELYVDEMVRAFQQRR